MAMGAIYQSMAHSMSLLFENAVSAQLQQNILAQAATTQGVMQIYSVDTVSDAMAAAKLAQSDAPDNMLSLLAALRAFGPGAAQAQAVDAAVAAVEALKPAPAQPASKPGA